MTKKVSVLLVTAPLIAALLLGGTADGASPDGDGDIIETSVSVTVPAAGNSYHVAGPRVAIPNTADDGLVLADPASVVDIYFRVGGTGTLNLGLVGSAAPEANTGRVRVTVRDVEHVVTLTGGKPGFHPVGSVEIAAPGYVKVSLSDGASANVTGLRIGGPSTTGVNNFCTVENLANRGDNWAYWARRGPSVHMSYPLGPDPVEYFYNELTVESGNDVVGSYFMTNGFGEGYCGFQVNSPTERRILFSVWSPYTTDDPHTIPPDQEVVLVKKGPGVRAHDFGGEGSGGQSYLVYPWKAGVTYKVLTRVRYHGPSSFESFPYLNEYTAWFFDPELDSWRLIAQWRRPDKSQRTYTGAHSFLENFSPGQGWITREVCFGNQWARGTDGIWRELTEGRFTCDNTARQGLRADFAGGLDPTGVRFTLRNCGFFDESIAAGTIFTRPGSSEAPDIDLDTLP